MRTRAHQTGDLVGTDIHHALAELYFRAQELICYAIGDNYPGVHGVVPVNRG